MLLTLRPSVEVNWNRPVPATSRGKEGVAVRMPTFEADVIIIVGVVKLVTEGNTRADAPVSNLIYPVVCIRIPSPALEPRKNTSSCCASCAPWPVFPFDISAMTERS